MLAAALLLPGIGIAQEGGPGPASLAFKQLHYRDRQPGLDRIRVDAPSWLARVPLGERFGVQAGGSIDSVSGASPRWHSAISSASRMQDRRHAADVVVTRYATDGSVSIGTAVSNEDDFESRSLSLQGRLASEDRNTSVNAGLALTHDRIGSSDDPTLGGRRRTAEATFGVTQIFSRQDIVQAALTHARGRGFYDDPYKRIDLRPNQRRQWIGTMRWNHHLEPLSLSLRNHYRYYRDSFGIRAHTLLVEAAWAPNDTWVLTPSLRLYTQRAASFYYDPVYSFLGAPFPPGWREAPPQYLSPDQRLAGFGAVSLALKLQLNLSGGWSADLKLERYEQRAQWRAGGAGSPGLAPFSARLWQWGLARQF